MSPKSNSPVNRFGLLLLLIAAASAVPRLILGSTQFIEYDGYWHVFIAQQDNWKNFWAEVYANAHPPLYFLLLQAVLHFGHSLLLYRSISIVTGVLTVALVGWFALRITKSESLGLLSAAVYGFALPAIIVSCEVRSYMLSMLFILLSWWGLLYVVASGKPDPTGKARAVFAVGAILGCLSHYFAFFYCGGAILVLFYRFGWSQFRGELADTRRALASELATSLPVIATIFTLYQIHAGKLAKIQDHLLPFYFDSHKPEPVSAFLLRNWKNFLNLFSPFPVLSTPVAIAILLLGIAGVVGTGDLLQRTRTSRERQASATVLLSAIMIAAIALTAVLGKYPFGGDLRQQYLLFPFLVLSLAVFVNHIAGPIASLLPSYGRLALGAAALVAIVWISAARYQQYPKVQTDVLADRMAEFNHFNSKPDAVYLDQYSLIIFFIYHHDWHWQFVPVNPPIPGINVYRLTRGHDQILVFRDKTQWNSDLNNPSIYETLDACLRASHIPDIAIFGVRQVPPKEPLPDIPFARRELVTFSAESSLCVQKMDVTPVEWYATFRLSGCPSHDGEQASGQYRVLQHHVSLSHLRLNAPGAVEQIVSGIYALEGTYRWTGKTAVVALKPPADPGPLSATFTINERSAARHVRLLLDGQEVAAGTYPGPGTYTLATASAVRPAGEVAVVALEADKTFTAPPDTRELGVVLSEIGWKAEATRSTLRTTKFRGSDRRTATPGVLSRNFSTPQNSAALENSLSRPSQRAHAQPHPLGQSCAALGALRSGGKRQSRRS